jgi:hypothetical protein
MTFILDSEANNELGPKCDNHSQNQDQNKNNGHVLEELGGQVKVLGHIRKHFGDIIFDGHNTIYPHIKSSGGI